MRQVVFPSAGINDAIACRPASPGVFPSAGINDAIACRPASPGVFPSAGINGAIAGRGKGGKGAKRDIQKTLDLKQCISESRGIPAGGNPFGSE